MKIWIVTHANEHGEGPMLPCPYATEEAAEDHADKVMREEWDSYGPEDDETGERLPYPDDWRKAQEAILKNFNDGSWTPYEITAHAIDFGPVVESAGAMLAPLKQALEAWPDWENNEPVNGGDMVEWFGTWRETVKTAIAKAEGCCADASAIVTPEEPAAPAIAPVDIYRVLKRYKDTDRFNWDYISAICREISEITEAEGRTNG